MGLAGMGSQPVPREAVSRFDQFDPRLAVGFALDLRGLEHAAFFHDATTHDHGGAHLSVVTRDGLVLLGDAALGEHGLVVAPGRLMHGEQQQSRRDAVEAMSWTQLR